MWDHAKLKLRPNPPPLTPFLVILSKAKDLVFRLAIQSPLGRANNFAFLIAVQGS